MPAPTVTVSVLAELLQAYVVYPLPASKRVVPPQATLLLPVITGVVGSGLTVTVVAALVDELHPLPSVMKTL